MTEFSEAWAKFMADNPTSFDSTTLGAEKGSRQYLENRLHRAFSDGWNKGAAHENERLGKAVMEKLKSL